MLLQREVAGRPVTVGLIGAGKFGTMFLAQARLTRGLNERYLALEANCLKRRSEDRQR